MPNFILEGESYFVYQKLDQIIKDKNVEFNPSYISQSSSMLNRIDYYVFFEPDKTQIESFNHTKSIFCYPDKNLDLRTDWVKKIIKNSEFCSFEPIPTTDLSSLQILFKGISNTLNLPIKKTPLKYKGSKQNYDWFDLMLISDLLSCKEDKIFEELFANYVDIWKFTDAFWAGNLYCLKQINLFNNDNFEEYFNRIRETSKDYIEILQTNAKTFDEHRKILPNGVVNNSFRFQKIKEKLNKITKKNPIEIIALFDECLKNVREGSNPKLELIKIFFEYKTNVI